jgi:hypothetical protein
MKNPKKVNIVKLEDFEISHTITPPHDRNMVTKYDISRFLLLTLGCAL